MRKFSDYFNTIFSKYLFGFRKGYSTQHCLLYMLECLRKALDKGMHTGILLTDLTKAFGSLYHDLLLSKRNSYGFSKLSLKMINDYLNPFTPKFIPPTFPITDFDFLETK